MPDVPASCAALVAGFEGFSSRPYLDNRKVSPKWTIGFGSTTDLHGQPIAAHTAPITRATGLLMLQRSLQAAYGAVMDHVEVPMTEPQEDALTSLTYNCGIGAFEGSTLLRKLNGYDYQGAADQFLEWDKAGGVVDHGLENRRSKERALFLSAVPASADPDATAGQLSLGV